MGVEQSLVYNRNQSTLSWHFGVFGGSVGLCVFDDSTFRSEFQRRDTITKMTPNNRIWGRKLAVLELDEGLFQLPFHLRDQSLGQKGCWLVISNYWFPKVVYSVALSARAD
jgi:hypothetical protein